MPPLVRMAVGAVAGMVAYKAMGSKHSWFDPPLSGIEAGHDHGFQGHSEPRLDLVARTMQEGLPVDRNGRIDPEVLDASALPRRRSRDIEPGNRPCHPEACLGNNPIKIDLIFQSGDTRTRSCRTSMAIRFMEPRGPTTGLSASMPQSCTPKPVRSRRPGCMGQGARADSRCTKIRVEVVSNQPAEHCRLPVYIYAKDADGKEYCLNKRLLEEAWLASRTSSPIT